MMKRIFSIILFLMLALSCAKPQVQTDGLREPEPGLIAKEIFNMVNAERQKRGLYRLEYDEKLADVALLRSKNMAGQDFLSSVVLEKKGLKERIEINYPEIIFGEVGENIGLTQGLFGEAVAKNLMEKWMNSPDLRANILSNQYSHIGVGIKRDGSRYYGTLKFIAAVVRVLDGTINEVEFGSEVTLKFEFVGIFDQNDLTIYCQFPDRSARYYTFDNQFYTGMAPLTPQWIDRNTFSVTFTFDKGEGVYTFQFGKEGNVYPRGYDVVAK